MKKSPVPFQIGGKNDPLASLRGNNPLVLVFRCVDIKKHGTSPFPSVKGNLKTKLPKFPIKKDCLGW